MFTSSRREKVLCLQRYFWIHTKQLGASKEYNSLAVTIGQLDFWMEDPKNPGVIKYDPAVVIVNTARSSSGSSHYQAMMKMHTGSSVLSTGDFHAILIADSTKAAGLFSLRKQCDPNELLVYLCERIPSFADITSFKTEWGTSCTACNRPSEFVVPAWKSRNNFLVTPTKGFVEMQQLFNLSLQSDVQSGWRCLYAMSSQGGQSCPFKQPYQWFVDSYGSVID